jgi:hypothetical protein
MPPYDLCNDPNCRKCTQMRLWRARQTAPTTPPRYRLAGEAYKDPFMPEVTSEDNASLAYFLSDPTCKSFRLTLAK